MIKLPNISKIQSSKRLLLLRRTRTIHSFSNSSNKARTIVKRMKMLSNNGLHSTIRYDTHSNVTCMHGGCICMECMVVVSFSQTLSFYVASRLVLVHLTVNWWFWIPMEKLLHCWKIRKRWGWKRRALLKIDALSNNRRWKIWRLLRIMGMMVDRWGDFWEESWVPRKNRDAIPKKKFNSKTKLFGFLVIVAPNVSLQLQLHFWTNHLFSGANKLTR